MSEESSPRRLLGPWSASAVVVASMIGVGLFTTSGYALADLGTRPRVLMAWAVGGVVACFGALSYAAIAKRFPESGGEYHYLAKMLHPLAGFLAGWISLLAGFTAPMAAAALGLQAYLAPIFGWSSEGRGLATAAILLAFAQHGFQVRTGVRLQNAIVGLKLLGLFGFLAYGANALEVNATGIAVSEPSGAFPVTAFAVSLVWISFAYSGWNATVYIAGEVRDPKRNLQRSLLGGCILVTLLYLALNTLFLYAAPIDAIAGQADVAAIAAEHLGGSVLQTLVRLLIALALLTSMSAMMMIGPRVYARMADDGLFPAYFQARSGNFRHAIFLQTVLALCVLWWSQLANLLGYIGFTLGLSTATTVVAMLLHRRKEVSAWEVTGYPWIPLLFVFSVLGSSTFLVLRSPTEAMWGLLTVVSGIPIYLLMKRRPSA
ncbi:MAG: amino acid permease [Planctomycetota bacterium]|nr:amino acid permease [Planctomycetota bacterium]MDA1114756.1 amino acid permease [Planctomycetota bacterium]